MFFHIKSRLHDVIEGWRVWAQSDVAYDDLQNGEYKEAEESTIIEVVVLQVLIH